MATVADPFRQSPFPTGRDYTPKFDVPDFDNRNAGAPVYDDLAASASRPRHRYNDAAKGSLGDIDIGRLCTAIRRSRRVLEYFRVERRNAVRDFVGQHWSRSGSEREMPVNLLSKYVQIMGRSLVAREPRVMLSTMQKAMKPSVDAMQNWCNKRLVEMGFAHTLRRFVTDAIFSIGIMKVGIASPHDEASGGYSTDTGVPFAEVVDLDDLAFDPHAGRFDRASFIAHRFRVPYDVAQKMKYFHPQVRKEMRPSPSSTHNEDGDERIGVVGTGYEAALDADNSFDELVDFWEIYLPRHGKVVTLLSRDGNAPDADLAPARVTDYFGPRCGPYHFLGFGTVPGNAMPKAPVMDLVALNHLINRLYRKLGNQAERQKSVLPVSGGQLDDGKALVQASDGQAFACDNPAAIKEVTYGGPSPANFQFVVHLADVFNEQGGNLRLLGGGGPQSKTATQDKMLNENSAATVADMQDATTCATRNVLDSLCWLWWNHPREVMTSTRQAPGLPDIEITRNLHPAGADEPLTRKGRFEDISLRVDPYSMQYKSPQQRWLFLTGLVKEFVPLMPILEKQGVTIDFAFLLKKAAEYNDEPDVTELFSVGEPPAEGPAGGGAKEGMPQSNDPKHYIRQSVGQDTPENRAHELGNDLRSELGGTGEGL